MLHRLNHYKDSPNPIDVGVINEGFSPLGMSVDELAAGFSHISMRCVSPVPDAERKPAFNEIQSSREFNETEEAENSSSIYAHGCRRAEPDPPSSEPGICPHGFRRADVYVCPHGFRRSQTPETSPLDVCPHGFSRAKVDICPHGYRRSCTPSV
ncbi:hypothetical protein C8R44DRAFT_896172 [Mycena epipterygia]|nr:hypothetical protein C8R44DRAFT_896172 [Mycena epipterygia]